MAVSIPAPSKLTRQGAQRAAARIVAEKRRLGQVPVNVDPIDVLLAEVGRSSAAVEFMDAIVQDLAEADLFGDGPGNLVAQQKIALWHAERDRLVNIASVVVKAGLQEQQIRLEAQQAALLASLLTAVISSTELGLDPEQQARARSVIASNLRALDEPHG